jgi:zinc protease
VFVPNNTIVAVAGDFDADEVIAEVKALVADWKRAELPNVARPKVELPAKFTQTILSMPQAAQLQVYLGHVGIRRDDPDFYKLLVMDYILGTGPGFTDRMSARLRDREGLAYTVSARITGTAGLEPGAFTCYIGTDTDKLDVVRKLFLEELNRIRNERPTAEEVADARTYLIGSRPRPSPPTTCRRWRRSTCTPTGWCWSRPGRSARTASLCRRSERQGFRQVTTPRVVRS